MLSMSVLQINSDPLRGMGGRAACKSVNRPIGCDCFGNAGFLQRTTTIIIFL
jgi:hypothetical protein